MLGDIMDDVMSDSFNSLLCCVALSKEDGGYDFRFHYTDPLQVEALINIMAKALDITDSFNVTDLDTDTDLDNDDIVE